MRAWFTTLLLAALLAGCTATAPVASAVTAATTPAPVEVLWFLLPQRDLQLLATGALIGLLAGLLLWGWAMTVWSVPDEEAPHA